MGGNERKTNANKTGGPMKLISLFLSLVLISTFAFADSGANKLTATNLYTIAEVTADTLGSAVDIKNYEGPIGILLTVSATGSSQKTVAVNVHHATSSGGAYAAVTGSTFTTVAETAGSQLIFLDKNALRRYLKLNIDVTTGDTISSFVSATILGVKKYRP